MPDLDQKLVWQEFGTRLAFELFAMNTVLELRPDSYSAAELVESRCDWIPSNRHGLWKVWAII
jgi:hypothetical protein